MNRVLKNKECIITNKYSNNHQAIDLVGINHTLDSITSHSDGVVVMIQTGRKNNKGSTGNESYGNFIKIKHNNNFYTLYAHLEYVTVKLNDSVKKGQIIGYMGDSGNAYGKHLHFEVWKNNKRINPTSYLNKSFDDSIYYQKYTGNSNSIVDALKSLNIDSSYENRKKIAIINGITNYSGTANQNIKLLNLLKKNKLKKE
jgi:hypothetical protein